MGGSHEFDQKTKSYNVYALYFVYRNNKKNDLNITA